MKILLTKAMQYMLEQNQSQLKVETVESGKWYVIFLLIIIWPLFLNPVLFLRGIGQIHPHSGLFIWNHFHAKLFKFNRKILVVCFH